MYSFGFVVLAKMREEILRLLDENEALKKQVREAEEQLRLIRKKRPE